MSWLRDQRLAAFAEMLEVVHSLWGECGGLLFRHDPDDAERGQRKVRVIELFSRLDSIHGRVRLLGPARVTEQSDRLQLSMREFGMYCEEHDLEDDASELPKHAPAAKARAAENAFIDAAAEVFQ